MEPTSAEQRAKCVERWKDSGLSAKEYAAEAGLNASTLYNWSAQLSAAAGKRSGHATAEQHTGSDGARRARKQSMPTPHFVELPVAAVTQTQSMLELVLGDVRVRVPSGFDEVTLMRVLRALGVAR